ncbi:PAS domain S-box protein [Paraflavisolibacter sp. H34]|uniref:PAS domain-containing sensor histidine kinase n=1 Tax=Huijunlia imazamoxiresistens TaxID=3127457 RepID=UPI00301AB9A4
MLNITNEFGPQGAEGSVSRALPEGERERRHQEALFQSMYEGSPDCIKILDLNGHILSMNQQGLRLIEAEGLPDVQGAWWPGFCTGDDRQAVLAAMERAKMGGIGRFEGYCPSRKGKPMWWEVVITPVYGEGDSVVQLLTSCRDITPRYQLERRVKEKEGRLRLALEAARMGAVDIDLVAETAYLDDRARELLCYEPGEESSLPNFMAKVYPGDTAVMLQFFEDLRQGRSVRSVEFRIGQEGGDLRWVRTLGQTYFNDQGRPVRRRGLVKDITEQKTAEQKLLQSERHFRNLFNNAPVSIWEEDISEVMALIGQLKAEGVTDFRAYLAQNPLFLFQLIGSVQVLDVNRASIRLFEANSKEELVQGLHRVFLPESLQLLEEELVVLASGATSFEGEAVLQTLKGKKITVLVSLDLPPGTDYKSVMVSLTDITERKKMEEERKAQAARIEQILELLPQIAWACTPLGEATYQSAAWCEYTGQSFEEALGMGYLDAIHPTDVEQFRDAWLQAAAEGGDFRGELRVRKKNGEYHWHLIKGIPFKDAEGTIHSWVGSCTDIHERVLKAEELEQIVAARTADLRQTNAELERSNRQLEEFAYVASHDLQEPLRKIRTFSGMLQQRGDALPPDLRMYLGRIDHSAQRMTDLVHSLLDYSRLSGNEAPPVPVPLRAAVRDVVIDYELLIAETGATLNVGALPVVKAQPMQLHQLFQNLINNALKFSAPGIPPVIDISSREVALEEGVALGLNPLRTYQEITVRDNGIGFEPEFAEKIFVVFQRLHDRGAYEGTGIGLAICKKIVTGLGGHIRAVSEVGKGAAFHVVLPVEA